MLTTKKLTLFFNRFLKFSYHFVFHQVHSMNMYLHKEKCVFIVQKVLNQLHDFTHFLLFKKITIETPNIIDLKDSK
jgi:hypothetical protein